ESKAHVAADHGVAPVSRRDAVCADAAAAALSTGALVPAAVVRVVGQHGPLVRARAVDGGAVALGGLAPAEIRKAWPLRGIGGSIASQTTCHRGVRWICRVPGEPV